MSELWELAAVRYGVMLALSLAGLSFSWRALRGGLPVLSRPRRARPVPRQEEPEPPTVTLPVDPANQAIPLSMLVTCPPLMISTTPLPS